MEYSEARLEKIIQAVLEDNTSLCLDDRWDRDTLTKSLAEELLLFLDEKPNPGSLEARARGCTCPVLDNAHGRGYRGTSGPDAIFVHVASCPVHWDRKEK